MDATVQEKMSNSRLRDHYYSFEQRSIAHIIEDVDRRVRIMCRLMQVYQEHPTPSTAAHNDPADMEIAMSIFYEYVDQQMNMLSRLSETIDDIGYVSINDLGRLDNV